MPKIKLAILVAIFFKKRIFILIFFPFFCFKCKYFKYLFLFLKDLFGKIQRFQKYYRFRSSNDFLYLNGVNCLNIVAKPGLEIHCIVMQYLYQIYWLLNWITYVCMLCNLLLFYKVCCIWKFKICKYYRKEIGCKQSSICFWQTLMIWLILKSQQTNKQPTAK